MFIRNAAAVGPRPHPEAVRALTLDICRHRNWTTPDRLRQTALFLKSMEAAVDRAYEMELEPGYSWLPNAFALRNGSPLSSIREWRSFRAR